MPKGRPRKPKIEVGERLRGRSGLNPRVHEVTPDKTKDYRWVTKNRVSERKTMDGYTPVKGNAEDGTVRFKEMVLMERSKELADESRKEKQMRTRMRTQSAKEQLGTQVERLSRKYGIDLHKAMSDYE